MTHGYTDTFWNVVFITALQTLKGRRLFRVLVKLMLTSKKAYNTVNNHMFIDKLCNTIFIKYRNRNKRYKNITNIKEIYTDVVRWYFPYEFYIYIEKHPLEIRFSYCDIEHKTMLANLSTYCVHRVCCKGNAKSTVGNFVRSFRFNHLVNKRGSCCFNHAYLDHVYGYENVGNTN